MFVLTEHPKAGKLRTPVHVWLPGMDDLEEGCLEQALHLSMFPWAIDRIALMPDTHQGYGMPIGGVMATREVVVPNAVGVDIGCGVAFCTTSLLWRDLSRPIVSRWVEAILEQIPQGFSHHRDRHPADCIGQFQQVHPEEEEHKDLWKELDRGYYQMGTLGGGNHFIELQSDEEGRVCVMIHSGSRNLGYQIAGYFNRTAQNKRKEWKSPVPSSHQLDYLPVDSREGISYIRWMKLAREFARENRKRMMERVAQVLGSNGMAVNIGLVTDVHHNDVNLETHQKKTLWIHRKGAIRAAKGEKGIIPGAMGLHSYVVEGLGNPESFMSCSHGAGRAMSRKQALKTRTSRDVVAELEKKGVFLGKKKKGDVAEEAASAYKNIDFVIDQQQDLIRPLMRLEGRAVIKG